MKEAEKVIAELEWFRSALIKGGKVPEYYEAQSGILTKAIKLLEQPEREKGKGIVHYECPKCGEITKDFKEYCPFCSADMRGEQDEIN